MTLLRTDYQSVPCSTCGRMVERCLSVIRAVEKRHGNITCTDCSKARSRARGIALRKPQRERNLMSRIATSGLQNECECYTEGKPTRYSENLPACPKCGLVNIEKFNQRHPYRLYQKHEDN